MATDLYLWRLELMPYPSAAHDGPYGRVRNADAVAWGLHGVAWELHGVAPRELHGVAWELHAVAPRGLHGVAPWGLHAVAWELHAVAWELALLVLLLELPLLELPQNPLPHPYRIVRVLGVLVAPSLLGEQGLLLHAVAQ